MRKNRIQNVIIHMVRSPDYTALTEKINELYAGYVERRLRDAGLTTDQKIAVIDGILSRLYSNEG